jgi:N-acetylglucosamine kinase-like BadF-type ATPase
MHPEEQHSAAPETVGLDIGGSKTHGVSGAEAPVAAEAKAGSANVQNVSAAEAAENLRSSSPTGGSRIAAVIAGSGGIDTEDDAARLRGLIAPSRPGRTSTSSTTPGSSLPQEGPPRASR